VRVDTALELGCAPIGDNGRIANARQRLGFFDHFIKIGYAINKPEVERLLCSIHAPVGQSESRFAVQLGAVLGDDLDKSLEHLINCLLKDFLLLGGEIAPQRADVLLIGRLDNADIDTELACQAGKLGEHRRSPGPTARQ